MRNEILIRGRLPGLNELIHENRRTPYAGAKLKRETEEFILWQLKPQIAGGYCRRPSGPVILKIEWHERTRRRDLDNIFSGKKFLLDALQTAGILEGDSQKHVCGLQDEFILDKEDYIRIQLIERGEQAPVREK